MRLGIALGPPARTAAAIELAVRSGAPAESLQGLSRPALVEEDDQTVILAHPGDLLTLCARDALDVAVLGKEVVLEGGFEVVELLDLGQGVARLVLAGVGGERDESLPRPLVATAHPRLTRRHFRARGRQPRLVEFASDPWIAGRLLAVDLVVGLLDEGEEPPAPLVEREQVLAGNLRLVAGLAAHALRGAELASLTRRFREAVQS